MSLEAQVAQLSNNVSQLIQRVATQADSWDQQVQQARSQMNSFINNAKQGYPVLNMFNNLFLDKVSNNQEPRGFYFWTAGCSVSARVYTESTDDTWWVLPPRFVRFTITASTAPSPHANPYMSVWTASKLLLPADAPLIKTTRSFSYRIVSGWSNIRSLKIGWETGSADLTETYDWRRVSLTTQGRQNGVIFSVYFKNPPQGESYTFEIDLKNIAVNIGESDIFAPSVLDIQNL